MLVNGVTHILIFLLDLVEGVDVGTALRVAVLGLLLSWLFVGVGGLGLDWVVVVEELLLLLDFVV